MLRTREREQPRQSRKDARKKLSAGLTSRERAGKIVKSTRKRRQGPETASAEFNEKLTDVLDTSGLRGYNADVVNEDERLSGFTT